MRASVLDINLFGACVVKSSEEGRFTISGAKHRALFALLATRPMGRRTRSFLQETLWGVSCYDTGRQSLRRALADIRQILGDSAGAVPRQHELRHHPRYLEGAVPWRSEPGRLPRRPGCAEPGFQQWWWRACAAARRRCRPLQHRPASPVLAGPPSSPCFRSALWGGEPADVVLGDWIAEDICRSLSRSNLLAVISHLSCRELARGSIDIGSIRSVLRADFCVVGTLRRSGGGIVLDADFVETHSGTHPLTRRFFDSERALLDSSVGNSVGIVSAVGAAIATMR